MVAQRGEEGEAALSARNSLRVRDGEGRVDGDGRGGPAHSDGGVMLSAASDCGAGERGCLHGASSAERTVKLGSAQGYSMTCRRQEYSVVHDEPESESLCTEQLLSRAESTIEVAWSLAIEPSPGRAASEASEPTSASAVGRIHTWQAESGEGRYCNTLVKEPGAEIRVPGRLYPLPPFFQRLLFSSECR